MVFPAVPNAGHAIEPLPLNGHTRRRLASELPASDLAALRSDDPAFVRRLAFDLVTLRRKTSVILQSDAVDVEKRVTGRALAGGDGRNLPPGTPRSACASIACWRSNLDWPATGLPPWLRPSSCTSRAVKTH